MPLGLRRKARYEEAVRGDGQAVPEPVPEPTLEQCAADIERERLFEIIRKLVLWENTTNETVLRAARNEIWQRASLSTAKPLPPEQRRFPTAVASASCYLLACCPQSADAFTRRSTPMEMENDTHVRICC